MGRRTLALVAACVGALAVTAPVASAARVVNGKFERGNLNGWEQRVVPHFAEDDCGNWFAHEGPYDPIVTRGDLQFPGPPQGKYAAIDQQTCGSAHILSQVVKLKARRKHMLRFKLAYLNTNGLARGGELPFSTPPTLSPHIAPNQQFRMDVMRPRAPLGSVKRKHVLKRVYRTNAGAEVGRGYHNVKARLTRFAGRKVRLRFAVVTTEAPLITGIDAVKIKTKRKKR